VSLDLGDPRLLRSMERVEPYAWTLLERAGEHALRLHADSVTPEHLLSVLMDDAECAATALVLHAFADPATIAADVLAISPGIMVVASDATLPFSPVGLIALLRARATAVGRGAGDVEADDLLLAALHALDPAQRTALTHAGLSLATSAAEPGEPGSASGEPLFKHFSLQAKRALSSANRLAAAARHAAKGPGHIVLGCLKSETRIEAAAGLSFQRARLVLGSALEDPSAPLPRRIPADAALIEFLEGLRAPVDSLAMLARCHAGATPELAQVLTRHKVSPALLEQARGAFRDPELPRG
jgi:hypothetical protein